MAKKILVLGIGPSQVDLIKSAKDMGMEVFACAYDKDGPGLELVDEFREIDIKNVEAVTEYAREKKVDVVYTMALESAVSTIAQVSEELNLPTVTSMETLNKITNKSVWRNSLGDISGNLKSYSSSKLSDFKKWSIYPAILKPVDGSGQRGVHKVNDFKDVEKVFDESIGHSTIGELIIEEYAEGHEISINTFMYKGELKVAVVSDRVSYIDYPGGIIKEHHIPSRIFDASVEEKAIKLAGKVNEILNFENGHIYFQMKVHNNEPKLIEFTPRFDACHMWRLIFHSTGLDLRKAALETLVYGQSSEVERCDLKEKLKKRKTIFISDLPGTIVKKSKYEIPENTLYTEWYYNEGEKVKSVTGYIEKVGYYIVQE